MQPIALIYTTFLLLSSQPTCTQGTLNPTPQIVLQCGANPFKCAGLTDPNTWPCCCFETDQTGCNARIDCKYNVNFAKCQVLLTIHPTLFPTENPTVIPTINPTPSPTAPPTLQTLHPTINPTQSTLYPSILPTYQPTVIPTTKPTHNPSFGPSTNPTSVPTADPTLFPTENPSYPRTRNPTAYPTHIPTINPTYLPTPNPTTNPSFSPSNMPTFNPTYQPTLSPTSHPTSLPTTIPTFTLSPTTNPTNVPSKIPTFNPTLTAHPTYIPTVNPAANPTNIPIMNPTDTPTSSPTQIPSYFPTVSPTNMPSSDPIIAPTTQCKECEIYQLTLNNIDTNLSIKECETKTKPIESNCECNGGMTSLTTKYIGDSIASKIEIIYKDNIVLCSFNKISPNTKITCNIKAVSNYVKFAASTAFKIYYAGNNNNRYCLGQYDTSCNIYSLGHVDTNCPYLMMNGWTDYDGNVCFNDDIDIKYWSKRSGSSDSSNHKNKRNAKKQSYGSSDGASSGSASSRRRRLGNGMSAKCIWNEDDKKYLWYKNTANGCNGQRNGRRRSLLWGNYYASSSMSASLDSRSDSSDNDDSDDEQWRILHTVCLTYYIGILRENCSALHSIFLPLCENNNTSFNSSSLSAEDITDLIVKYSPEEAIIPVGYRDNNDILGILVNLMSSDVTEFELCLGNVTIDLHMSVNYTKDAIDMADSVTFIIGNESSICQSDGLPCLNFYFQEECATTTAKMNRNCDCKGRGLQSMTFLYSGDKRVHKIEVFRRQNVLCTFNNVSSGDMVVCNEAFMRRTFFKITYSKNDEICDGIFRTDCSRNLLGATLCDGDLIVTQWIDKSGAICDETVSDWKISRHNALIHDKYDILNNTLQVFKELDIYIKWALIGIMIMFGVLMCIGFNIYVFDRFYHKNIGFQSETEHKKLQSTSIVKQVHEVKVDEMENTKFKAIDNMAENDDIGKQQHRIHKSINFDEEEVVNNIYEMEEEAVKETYHKHKNINFNEEEYLNNEDHSDGYYYNEESDADSTML